MVTVQNFPCEMTYAKLNNNSSGTTDSGDSQVVEDNHNCYVSGDSPETTDYVSLYPGNDSAGEKHFTENETHVSKESEFLAVNVSDSITAYERDGLGDDLTCLITETGMPTF